jgi:hypothetical protein
MTVNINQSGEIKMQTIQLTPKIMETVNQLENEKRKEKPNAEMLNHLLVTFYSQVTTSLNLNTSANFPPFGKNFDGTSRYNMRPLKKENSCVVCGFYMPVGTLGWVSEGQKPYHPHCGTKDGPKEIPQNSQRQNG